MSFFFLGILFFFFFLSSNTIMTLFSIFSIDSKDNTGTLDKINLVENPWWKCMWSERWKGTIWVRKVHVLHSRCIKLMSRTQVSLYENFENVVFFWKPRTSKCFTKGKVFFEVKCMSHMRLKIQIAPIYCYFLGGSIHIPLNKLSSMWNFLKLLLYITLLWLRYSSSCSPKAAINVPQNVMARPWET